VDSKIAFTSTSTASRVIFSIPLLVDAVYNLSIGDIPQTHKTAAKALNFIAKYLSVHFYKLFKITVNINSYLINF